MKNLLKGSNNRPTVPASGALRSNSVGSAPPSPRTLADTLSSPQLRENFQQFLKHLDANAGTPPNHCGRAGSLKFVVAVKQIAQSQERNRPEEWIQFFPTDNTGLVLNNDPNLWRRCAEATKKVLIHKTNEYLLFTSIPFPRLSFLMKICKHFIWQEIIV